MSQKTQIAYFAILMVFIGVCWYKMWVFLRYARYRFMVRLWVSGGIQSVRFHELKRIKIRVYLCGRECGEIGWKGSTQYPGPSCCLTQLSVCICDAFAHTGLYLVSRTYTYLRTPILFWSFRCLHILCSLHEVCHSGWKHGGGELTVLLGKLKIKMSFFHSQLKGNYLFGF